MVNSQPNLYNYGREVAKPLESIVKDQIYDDQDPLTTDSEVHLKKVFLRLSMLALRNHSIQKVKLNT